jgi:hypothetical protein
MTGHPFQSFSRRRASLASRTLTSTGGIANAPMSSVDRMRPRRTRAPQITQVIRTFLSIMYGQATLLPLPRLRPHGNSSIALVRAGPAYAQLACLIRDTYHAMFRCHDLRKDLVTGTAESATPATFGGRDHRPTSAPIADDAVFRITHRHPTSP